jgi:DNA-binding transcriptional MocR family regulator
MSFAYGDAEASSALARTIDWPLSYARRAGRIRASEIRELLRIVDRPGIISFAGGIPDPELFPVDAFRAAVDGILGNPKQARVALQYSVTEGYEPLRVWIADYMRSRGTPCSSDNILITAGAQQALDLIAKLFAGAGDTILVTAPTYLGALQVFDAYEANYGAIDLSGRADCPYAFETAGERLAAAYIMADCANPTGRCLTKDERFALLTLSERCSLPIIEDAAYEALRFEGDALPSCQSLDILRCGSVERSRVLYCGSFSKTMAPGLRLGWICAASEVIRKLTLAKQGVDLHTGLIGQMAMLDVVERLFDRQRERVRDAYRCKRGAMLAALQEFMPAGVSWTEPEGGMFVWLSLPEAADSVALLPRALDEAKVAFVPGPAFYAAEPKRNTLRLNYSKPSMDEISSGIKRLGRLIREIHTKDGRGQIGVNVQLGHIAGMTSSRG